MRTLLVLLAVSLAAGAAHAHDRSMSYSTWQLRDDGAAVELRLKLLELTRQPPGHPWQDVLPGELQLYAGGRPCPADRARRQGRAPDGWAVFRWDVHCDAAGPREIASALLGDVAASHTHFARLETSGDDAGAGFRERVLVTGRDDPWGLDEDARRKAAPSTLRSYAGLGVLHIATGWDHLAFVLALLLLAASPGEVVRLVTGFTVGHSLTLGLAVVGVVRPEGVAVEVLIGFSIALVAAENAWLLGGRDRWIPALSTAGLAGAAALAASGRGAVGAVAWLGLALFTACHFALLRRSERPERLRAGIAFAFGLVHGFGFAGILMELELPASRLLTALFGFNLGVEVGQLAVVAVVWPLLFALARVGPGAVRRVAELGSATIFGLGLFWLVSRNF